MTSLSAAHLRAPLGQNARNRRANKLARLANEIADLAKEHYTINSCSANHLFDAAQQLRIAADQIREGN